MNSFELLNAVVKHINDNPLNQKKIYLTHSEIVRSEENPYLEVKFGASQNNSLVFKEYFEDGENINEIRQRLCSIVLNKIFENIYNRIDTDTFSDNRWSKIVRVEEE